MRNPNIPYIRSLYPKGLHKLSTGNQVLLLSHSMEAPDVKNLARSLARGWWQNPSNQTSVHNAIDRGEAIQTYPYGYRVWGVGTGNDYVLVQTEHVGYARWSREQWRTDTMMDCMRLSAKVQAWCWNELAMKDRGIKHYPEWLTTSEITNGKSGLLTHNDARLVWGGTSHYDPGKNFPYKELRDMIHEELDVLRGGKKHESSKGVYTVVKGDTLSSIAQRFNVDLHSLVRLNNIKNPNLIHIGEKIDLSVRSNSKPTPYTPPPGKYPFSGNNHFGIITGNKYSHGGYYHWEEPYVTWIQTRMQELGYAGSNSPSWVDGKYERPTVNAVAKWQKENYPYPKTTLPGQVWADDYSRLENING